LKSGIPKERRGCSAACLTRYAKGGRDEETSTKRKDREVHFSEVREDASEHDSHGKQEDNNNQQAIEQKLKRRIQ